VTDARKDWQEALAPTADCVDVDRFGATLNAPEQAHLESCVRCQSELALFREITRDEASAEEHGAAQWIAAGLQRRAQQENAEAAEVVVFRPRPLRVLYSIAAAIAVLIGAAYWMQMREPSIDPALDPRDLYRSERIELVAPIGDIPQAPNEMRWAAVSNATRYLVEIVEVDDTVVWSSETDRTSVPLPSNVIAQFAPGKSLKWQVKAFRGKEMLASSQTETVRVAIPRRNLQ
jgi:hypothetical protein